ncbi:GNAT family N-acetyltransferase [bacterium]|nr:GNAT family N-acetyltransferase [bacterium]
MADKSDETPLQTIETVAKTLYKQAREYGFVREDFIRFINILLDLVHQNNTQYVPPPTQSGLQESGEGFSIKTPRIQIQRYKPSDLKLLKKWMEDSEGIKFISTRVRDYEPESIEDLLRVKSSVFGIIKQDELPIGTIAYLNIDTLHKKAELRKLIAEESARGRGFAKEATQYWIEYGVTNLGLRKIYLNTLDTNLANIRINEQLGFRVEGLLREECFIDGKYHDLLRMSLILPH